MTRRSVASVVLALLAASALASAALAQWGYGRSRYPPRFRPANHVDEGFTFCRLMYTSNRRERSGRGWSTDYPFADINFMIRLSEMTSTHVNLDPVGEPNHWVVTVTDDALYGLSVPDDLGRRHDEPAPGGGGPGCATTCSRAASCGWTISGGRARGRSGAGEIAKVLPPGEYPIKDLPLDHSVFKTMFHIREIPQISNIHFWRWSGGATTSERGPDSEVPHFRGITDEHGRLMVAHDAQHRHPGRVGARRGGPAVLRAVLAGRLPVGRERRAVRDEPLTIREDA